MGEHQSAAEPRPLAGARPQIAAHENGARIWRQPGLPERGMARQWCRLRVWLWRFMAARLQVSGIVAGQVFMTAVGPGDAQLSVTAQGTGSNALQVADIGFIITNVQEFRA